MNTHRRRITLAAGLAPLAALLPRWASAAPLFESLSLFIPAAPGGGWDTTGRVIEQVCRAAGLVGGVQFENVGGAGGMVGLPKFVAQRKGQGNWLLVGGSVMVGAGIANKSPVTIRNVVPIARLTEEAGVVVVPASSPHRSWKDFAAALKANPKGTSVAGGSAGGTDHLLLGMMIRELGANPKEASYVAFAGGGAAVAAVIGGQVSAGISGYSEFAEHIKAGRLRAIAVSGNARIPGVDVPTLKELGVPITTANWRGVFAPPGVSAAQQKALTELMGAMHRSAQWKEQLEQRKWVDVFLAGDDFARDVAEDIRSTEAVMKDLGLA
ncbi:MAG: tripartite tricarboxylate transporter substrate-binding protein [Candidatus Dactylopiibacterium sp.]|nr:tripartite tricarboxylate transporter substrate-binding protein [Candidatus Dactylopiibacterium sp.]